jgi:hypothetical protein
MTTEMLQPIERPSKMVPALIGGAIIGFISATPFLNLVNCLCCAGVILGGFLAVYFYKDQLTPDMPAVSASEGVSIGALAGVFGFLIAVLLEAVIYLLFGNIGTEIVIDMVIRFVESFGGEMPPEFYEGMRESAQQSPLQPLSLIMNLVVTIIFSIVGGLIGSAVFKPKAPQIQQ